MIARLHTYRALQLEGRLALERAGIENAALDARVLLQQATRRTRAELFRDEDKNAAPGEIARFDEMVARRAACEPVALITGVKEFWSLEFLVTPATLVPRPESEHLIERALEFLPKETAGRVLDLGTGTGCLLVSLLRERPRLSGVGLDISFAALGTARKNAERHGVAGRAAFVCGNWAEALAGAFDLVIANPPYISQAELAMAAPEVRDYEPRIALCPGTEGHEAYGLIAQDLNRVLRPGGHAVFEIGAGQAERVCRILEAAGLEEVDVKPDFAALPRVVSAQKPFGNKELAKAKKRLESAS